MNKYDICVVGGAGHAGLPLSLAFANSGQKVVIYDINQKVLNLIKQGRLPFLENGAEEILKKVINKTLFTNIEKQVITHSKFVIVVIGTPVDGHLNPAFHTMKKFFKELIPFFRNDQIIILRSTVFPGISQKVREILKMEYPDIEVCFCPERIAEGKAIDEIYSFPQIISGFDETSIKQVSELFNLLTKDIITTTPIEAELTKLFTNTWRYITFATANQFYMIAEEHGVDFYNIYNAMTYKYPRASSFPKAGFAAGPCLFKDTMQVSSFAQNTFFIGHSAMLVNEGLPNFLVQKIKKEHDLANLTVGILGMAYKAESDDKRESLSYKLKKILDRESKEVLCSDVYIKDDIFIDENQLIDKSDIIIIGAPHKKYIQLDYKNKVIFDIWNYINKK